VIVMRCALLPLWTLLGCSAPEPGPEPALSDGADGGSDVAADAGGGDAGGSDEGAGDGGGDEGGGDAGDGTGDSGEDTASPYAGVWLEPPLALPVFEATNRDGSARGPEHLVGDPTIIWFYRDAGAAG